MKVMYCGTAQWLAGVTILWIGSASDERCSFSFIKADLIVCSAFAAAADLHSCIDHQNAPMAGHQRVRSGSVGSLFKFRDPLRVHQRLTLCTRLTAVSSVSALCISLHCHVQAANSSSFQHCKVLTFPVWGGWAAETPARFSYWTQPCLTFTFLSTATKLHQKDNE